MPDPEIQSHCINYGQLKPLRLRFTWPEISTALKCVMVCRCKVMDLDIQPAFVWFVAIRGIWVEVSSQYPRLHPEL